MTKVADKREARVRRHMRVRAKVVGTEGRPRLAVYKSNRYLYVQLVDDEKGKTLAAFSSKSKEIKGETLKGKAREIGKEVAKEAKRRKLKGAVFDRGGFTYAGVVREVAEGAREGGLKL